MDKALRANPYRVQSEYKRTHNTLVCYCSVTCISNTICSWTSRRQCPRHIQLLQSTATGHEKSLGVLTEMRRQVQLAQMPLSEIHKNTLLHVLLVHGQVLGTQAQEELDERLFLITN